MMVINGPAAVNLGAVVQSLGAERNYALREKMTYRSRWRDSVQLWSNYYSPVDN